ncbi:MAG: HlyD family efflux transporter periplasmic adaptor subunit [Pseudomonadota bacterium]
MKIGTKRVKGDPLFSADEAVYRQARGTIWFVFAAVAAFFLWAWLAQIDEVSSGPGTVMPVSGSQVIQSLEGGIIDEIFVSAGDVVERGEPLVRLDADLLEAEMGEVDARLDGALARKARLEAEVGGVEPTFPEELDPDSEVVARERQLYRERKENLTRKVDSLENELGLVRQEKNITQELLDIGAASEVDLLKLKRKETELRGELDEVRDDFLVSAREELSDVRTEVESYRSVLKGKEDVSFRQTVRSPVHGRVQKLETTTVGGVIPPNGKLMEIVPLDDRLVIEARISPRDIAYIHPEQQAKVKITAYDYAIYGAMEGKVESISPDTERDEIDPKQLYYRVRIVTEGNSLVGPDGAEHHISPGMVAQVDIRTGQRSVLWYLAKPFNKAREALRER